MFAVGRYLTYRRAMEIVAELSRSDRRPPRERPGAERPKPVPERGPQLTIGE